MSNTWQQQASDFAQKHNLTPPVGVYALDLVSEVGEVAKEILLATKYGEQEARFSEEFLMTERTPP